MCLPTALGVGERGRLEPTGTGGGGWGRKGVGQVGVREGGEHPGVAGTVLYLSDRSQQAGVRV